MPGSETNTAYEESKDCHLKSLQRGIDQKHDSTDGIRKPAEYVDGVNQPMEAHQVRNEACEPPVEDRGTQIFRMGNRPEKRHKSYPGYGEQNRRKERSC